MAGAFGPGQPGRGPGRQDERQDGPQDALSSFSKKLAQVSGSAERPIRPGHPGRVDMPPSDLARSTALSAMDKLAAMVKSKTPVLGGRTAPGSARMTQPPKGEFVPGQRPHPTGPTAHEIMTHPAHQAVLQDVIATHEKLNPGRSLKAPALMNLWNAKNPGKPLNEARARTVVAKVNKARDSYVQKQVASYMRKGAKAAT